METPLGKFEKKIGPKEPLLGVIEEESYLDMDTLKVLRNIDQSLKEIKELLEINQEDCKKMSSHIDFVENVYGTLKSPLEFIRSKMGYSSEKLPSIEN